MCFQALHIGYSPLDVEENMAQQDNACNTQYASSNFCFHLLFDSHKHNIPFSTYLKTKTTKMHLSNIFFDEKAFQSCCT